MGRLTLIDDQYSVMETEIPLTVYDLQKAPKYRVSFDGDDAPDDMQQLTPQQVNGWQIVVTDVEETYSGTIAAAKYGSITFYDHGR